MNLNVAIAGILIGSIGIFAPRLAFWFLLSFSCGGAMHIWGAA